MFFCGHSLGISDFYFTVDSVGLKRCLWLQSDHDPVDMFALATTQILGGRKPSQQHFMRVTGPVAALWTADSAHQLRVIEQRIHPHRCHRSYWLTGPKPFNSYHAVVFGQVYIVLAI